MVNIPNIPTVYVALHPYLNASLQMWEAEVVCLSNNTITLTLSTAGE